MFVPLVSNPRQNRLLATLPDSDYGRLLPDFERISMPLGWTVWDAAAPGKFVYFPSTAVVSMLHTIDSDSDSDTHSLDADPAEITFAGSDGLVGVSLIMAGEQSLRRGIVYVAGEGYRIKADILKSEFALGLGFQQLARRYAKSVRAHLAHAAECGRDHSPAQLLSSWLLLCSDSCASTELPMTSAVIANMLRRGGVAQAVEILEMAGVIHYSRGHIAILDRAGLEQYACECYVAVKGEIAALLNGIELAEVSGRGDQVKARAPSDSRSAS